jgi:hypothetical protein
MRALAGPDVRDSLTAISITKSNSHYRQVEGDIINLPVLNKTSEARFGSGNVFKSIAC